MSAGSCSDPPLFPRRSPLDYRLPSGTAGVRRGRRALRDKRRCWPSACRAGRAPGPVGVLGRADPVPGRDRPHHSGPRFHRPGRGHEIGRPDRLPGVGTRSRGADGRRPPAARGQHLGAVDRLPAWIPGAGSGLASDPTVAERLILEITESSAMMMPDTVRVFMQDLHLRGVCFALDDFGAGNTWPSAISATSTSTSSRSTAVHPRDRAHADNQVLCRALMAIATAFRDVHRRRTCRNR